MKHSYKNKISRSLPAITWLAVILVMLSSVRPAEGQAQTTGQWTTLPYTMPINPVHAALMHNGKVLVVAGSGNYPANLTNGILQAAIWDPGAGTVSVQNVSWDMFCNGMVGLADGREFIFGGTLQYDPFHGESSTATFDLSTGTFTNQQSMAHGRWYPTGIVLSNGSVMVFSGTDENGNTNTAVEIYTPGSGWSTQYLAGWTPPLYPRLHLLPNGKVFYSGPGTSSALFDPSTHAWTRNVANTNYAGVRTYGTSVLLPLTPQNSYTPQVLIMGGGNPATNTTEIINLGASTPTWKYSAPMSEARIEMNAVILPTGKVLALGGSVNDEDTTTASLAADLFDPATQTMTSAGSEAYARLYHSVALLMPDATVWVAGGNPSRGTYVTQMEIYQPAYLFTVNSSGQTVLATRPTITGAPSSVTYGSSFQVQTPDAANVGSVVLLKNGSVTHAFNMDQRMVGLSFTAGSGVLTVTAPSNGNIAPPGYYMLFLVNKNGVPSVANFVQVGASSSQAGAIKFVQVKAATPQSVIASVPVAYASSQNAGDLNVVVVGWNDTTSSVSSVTDTSGNTYVQAVGPTTASGARQSIYYAKNIKGGSNTVTVTFNQAAAYPDIRVLEYAGADTSSPLDVTAAAVGSSTTANSGSATTTSANELVFGADTIATGTPGPGAGFTSRIITSPDSDIAEDKIVSTTGSYSATAPLSPSGYWVMQMATFKAAGSGGGTSAPTVSSVSPTSGSTNGGTGVTITGTNFAAGATVTFGGTAATNVSFVSSTSITATTPAHAAGAVSVVVTNTGGQSGTLSSGFTYTAPAPTVSSVSPNSGSTNGGTAVTITGTNFAAGASVTFGGTAATNVSVASSTSITATTPAHAAGAVNVVVTNSGGQSGTLSSGFTYTSSTSTPISFVQVAAATPQTASSTVSVAYKVTQTAGDLNIVVVGWNDTTSLANTPTDTLGNTYTLAVGPTTASGARQSIYYAKNIKGGSNTVTVTFNQAAAAVDVRVLEYKGLSQTSPLDVTAAGVGSSTTASSGSATTTSANELIFGADTIATGTPGPGAGFTTRIITSPDSDIAEDKIVSTTGSYSATAPVSPSGYWVMQMATFKQ